MQVQHPATMKTEYTSLLIIAQLMAFIKTDNLVLLSGTLRQFQQTGCDDEQMTLTCPPGTSISVELAQYDMTGTKQNKCPPKLSHNQERNVNLTSCTWPTAIQNKWEEMTKGTWGRYSLLQTVVEACQKKKSCKFRASLQQFGGVLCPEERKYIIVAYKCRPYEFRSRVACENERVQLQCNPNSRVAIYSASYGRTEYESFQCPQAQGVAEETCLVSYATETVMKLCHGKRYCEFGADSTTFGNPCHPQTKMYLRIVYTCVPQKVLSIEYEEPLGEDETEQEFTYDQEDFDTDLTKEKIREFSATPNKQLFNLNETVNMFDSPNNFPTNPISVSGSFNENPEKFEFFLQYGWVICLVVFLVFVICISSRILIRKHHDLPAATETKFQNFQSTDPPVIQETSLSLDIAQTSNIHAIHHDIATRNDHSIIEMHHHTHCDSHRHSNNFYCG